MQTPYCVIDATTLVENVHEIKKWIYNGQVRIIVPWSTLERVEQLYQKTIEQKPKPQEPARPRSSGKTARKEHPTYDINPRLARAFLARLQHGKDHGDLELPFHVEFQQANEVYTPWTLAEAQGEKRDGSPEKGPTTFAQAVAKSNLVTQIPGTGETVKGPAKPKLVARAPGSDKSPWKIGRKVPQIPLREVPVEVRPALSYVLWRLHESHKGRADASSLIVLSDDLKTQSAGQKLDIVVKRIEEIRNAVAAQVTEIDRNAFGDLERDFGPTRADRQTLQNRDLIVEETSKQIFDVKGEEKSDKKENILEERSANNLDTSANGFIPQEVEHDIKSGTLPRQSYPTAIDIAEDNMPEERSKLIEPADPVSNEFVSEKISNITTWIKNLAPKLSSSPEPNSNSQRRTDGSKKDKVVSLQPVVLQQAAKFSTPSPRTSNASPAPAPPVEGPEDSDEEVVVFNPKAKRLSAHHKPQPQSPQQNIAPLAAQSPKSNGSQSPKQNAQRSLRKAAPKAPTVTPAIIDPDAFGRSFATNPKANVHNNHPNSRYSPRGSPRRATRTPEPELDYVLKSGNTRASVRGKGKLWVP